jgi:hypothetical protein
VVESKSAAPAAPRRITSVKIRPYSDVVYLWPALLASIICGLVVTFSSASPTEPGVTGLIFTIIFFVNLSVIAFNYTRLMTIIILLLAVILGLVSAMYPAVAQMVGKLLNQPLFMNSTFYWVWAAGLTVLMVGAVVRTRWDYWEIKNNELLHHHGLMGDVERWPAPGMRISKEIDDVMEYLLFGAGRLVLMPQNERRAIVIDNVPFISRLERDMQHLLSTLRVETHD